MSQGDISANILSVGLDFGIEVFPVESWSLRMGPTYRYIHEGLSSSRTTATSTVTDNVLGINWGIAGYF